MIHLAFWHIGLQKLGHHTAKLQRAPVSAAKPNATAVGMDSTLFVDSSNHSAVAGPHYHMPSLYQGSKCLRGSNNTWSSRRLMCHVSKGRHEPPTLLTKQTSPHTSVNTVSYYFIKPKQEKHPMNIPLVSLTVLLWVKLEEQKPSVSTSAPDYCCSSVLPFNNSYL